MIYLKIKLTLFFTVIMFLSPPVAPAKDSEIISLSFIAKAASRIVTLTGFTRGRARMSLVSEISGRVDKVNYEVGQAIDPSGYFAQMDVTFLQFDLEKNQIDQDKVKSRISYLDLEAGRYRTMVGRNSAAQTILDKLEQDLDSSNYNLKALQIQEKKLREKIERGRIKAPAGWKVIVRNIEPGEWVPTGHLLAEIGDFSTLIIPFALTPQGYESLLKHGESFSLFRPDKNIRVQAGIWRISPAFDLQTRKINVDLKIISGIDDLRGGIRLELPLVLSDKDGALLVPKEGVENRYEEYWLTRRDGKQVSVLLLGSGPAGTLRVFSPEIHPGDQFLFNREP